MEGDTAMSITIEKGRLNLWNVVGFIIGIAVTAFGWGITYSSMLASDTENKRSIEAVQKDVSELKGHVPTIAQLQFQSTATASLASENKKGIEETNKRMDRIVETFGDRLDVIIDRVNQIATSVEVLAAKDAERPRKTSLEF